MVELNKVGAIEKGQTQPANDMDMLIEIPRFCSGLGKGH